MLEKNLVRLKKKSDDILLKNTIANAAESFGISQEVAIAQMIMAAPQAVGHSFKKASETYAPPFSLIMGALGAAGTIIPIIKGLSDIKKARFSKSKKATPSGGTISAPTAAPAATTIAPELITDLAANNSARLGVDSSIGDAAGAAASNNISGSASPNVIFSEAQYTDFQNQIKFKEEKTTV